MNTDLYQQFIALKDSGKKMEAKAALDSFISSFETLGQKRDWVYSFLETEEYGHRIRHEIYENLVYPVLLDGYLNNYVNSVVWLAKTASNLYNIKSLHPSLESKSEFALFKEAYALEPNEEIRTHLLTELLRGFQFSQHEWPVGLIYRTNGDDTEQCEELLREIEFARSLDHQNKHSLFISSFEAKVHEHIKRLA